MTTRIIACLFLCFGLCISASAQTLTDRIDALRLTSGHLPGAYSQNAGAAGLRWYFSTTGVHAVALDLQHDQHVRAYLDVYLGTAVRPGGAIDDVHNLTVPTIEWKLADSDDSYAAGILSMASWYAQRPGGAAWFRGKLPQLKFIATANLVDTIQPEHKLTQTFNKMSDRFTAPLQTGRYDLEHQQTLKTCQAYQKVCQLMDNCEAYRGLDDFARQLAAIGDPDAATYRTAANTIAEGIRDMFDPAAGCFRVNTLGANPPEFYPSRFIQIAPEVYGIPLGDDQQAIYDAAWKYLNGSDSAWWNCTTHDGSNNGAPMMILAYAAALRGEKRLCQSHLQSFQIGLQNNASPGMFHIGELGWALRAERALR